MVKQTTSKIQIKPTSKKDVVEKWYIVDVTGQKIGRVATVIAETLLGKHQPKMVSNENLIPKNKIVVINCSKLHITQKKSADKKYTNYSGFPGGLRTRTLGEVMEQRPTEVIEHAVKGMLPKNRRGRALAANLFLYAESEYAQTVQQPESIKL